MELSDRHERITVTLELDDWGTIMAALSTTPVPLETRSRINAIIFDSAQSTERMLS